MNEFEEIDFSNEKFSIGIWKKILHLVLKRKKGMIGMIIFVLMLAGLDVVFPLLNTYAIKEFFTNKDYSNFTLFIIFYLLIAIGYIISIYGFIRLAGKVENEVGFEIRTEAFNNLQRLSLSYYDKTSAGWIFARLSSDSRRLSDIISWGIVDLFWGISSMLGALVIMFIVKWQLALIIVGLLPILILVSLYFRKKILANYRNVRKINSQITGSFNEGILGGKTTKTLVLENQQSIDFTKICKTMRSNSIRAIMYSSIFFPILLVISYVGVAVILRVGGSMILGVVETTISVATLYFFITCTTNFFDPVMQLARILADFQQAQASAERILSLIETKPDIIDNDDVIEKYGDSLNPKMENWEELKGDVEFRDVNFFYKEGEPILKDFNLKVKVGTSVALVGETGAGKSTIVNLICRFYEPNSGKILIDGVDYKERSISWLHSNLGYVLQTPHLFNTSIKDNIRYGKMDATFEEIKEASKLIGIDEFIESLPDGYDTVVGEGGNRLSVGQKQLISFARAIISNPKILVLDEATSSIDTKTEEIVQKAINKLLVGRTSFIIAHRLSTIQNADRILVINDGKICEDGTHKELIDLHGEYYELYLNQFVEAKTNEVIKKEK